MLHQALILTSHREYAHAMRIGLLGLGDAQTRVDLELDALRAMQLVPQQYELILLDVMLDTMDGLQLLMLLKQQAPATKFIVVSDSSNEVIRAQGYQNGADYFIERPKSAKAMQTTLEAIRGLLSRGLETRGLPAAKEGELASVADIVQTRCLSGDSVLLLVQSKNQSGDVFIFRGDVYHAQYPGKSGEAAFHDIMHWDGGQVRIKEMKLSHVPPRTIEKPYLQLLDSASKTGALDPGLRPSTGELLSMAAQVPPETSVPSVVEEAPPLEEKEAAAASAPQEEAAGTNGETPLPAVNSHWKINLMGELVEGSQLGEPDRCAFISYFIYRKMADVAVALEVDYFTHLSLFGHHLQQVLVADNLGLRHAVFDTAWTDETKRNQYVQWCCEQSF